MSSFFDNSFLRLSEDFYSEIKPEKMPSPEIIKVNRSLAKKLNLNERYLQKEYLSGNKLIPGSKQFAQKYAGHQFGNFVPNLGDGRAIMLGEIIDNQKKRQDIQLKGSGKTPFSRMGDGRAGLGPVIREYLISESMHYLGIPSTRSLAILLTGEKIIRENIQPGALLVRVASSHIRIGTFEYFAYKNDIQNIQKLADYCIERHYPEINEKNKYLKFLQSVSKKQALLISKWMGVGFVHGVMNTDNSTISGETIDFGPCAFLEEYEEQKVFSSIDIYGRYSFSNQPLIMQWNLSKLAESIIRIIDKDDLNLGIKKAEKIINEFPFIYHNEWMKVMRKKFGLSKTKEEDETLFKNLLKIMEINKSDYTSTFRKLRYLLPGQDNNKWKSLFNNNNDPKLLEWINDYQKRLSYEISSVKSIKNKINSNNPSIIPRNHKIQKIIDDALNGNFKSFHQLDKLLKEPFSSKTEKSSFSMPALPDEVIKETFCGT